MTTAGTIKSSSRRARGELSALGVGVRAIVAGFERRRRAFVLARGVAIAAAFALGWVILAAIVDRLTPLPAWTRGALLMANAGVTLVLIARAVRGYALPPTDWVDVAGAVEGLDPGWNQRLSTLVSCATSDDGAAVRHVPVSRELLDAIAADAEARIGGVRGGTATAARLLRLRILTPSLSIAGGTVIVLGLLLLWPWLGLRSLLARQLMPFGGSAGEAPVSAVLLEVTPGPARAIHGEPFHVAAVVRRRDGRPVVNPTATLRISTGASDGFAAMPMSRRAVGTDGSPTTDPDDYEGEMLGDEDETEIAADALASASTPPAESPPPPAPLPPTQASFGFGFPAVDHDFRYVVTSGDATAGPFDVRVLRRPAVLEFRITYREPAYLRHRSANEAPRRVTNGDGLIESWHGSEALVELVATEPLRSAELVVNGRRVPALPTANPAVRHTTIAVDHDAPYSIELVSREDVRGSGPPTARVRAVPDLPPTAQWVSPSTDQIPPQLRARDAISLRYEARDDDGVVSMRAVIRGARGAAWDLPISQARAVTGAWNLDLANLNVDVGSRLDLVLEAIDSAGQMGRSVPLSVLIAPRRVDEQARRWAELLNRSGRRAQALAERAASARQRIDQPLNEQDRASAVDDQVARTARATREAIPLAYETAALVDALIDATAASDSPQSSVLLSRLIDAIQGRASELQASTEGANLDRLRSAIESAGNIARETALASRVMEDGARAVTALAELENSEATTRPADAEPLRKDADAISRGLGVAATTKDELKAELAKRAEAARQLAAGQAPVDFAAAAREFARDRADARDSSLPQRLAAGGRAEAARPDADRVRAGDLGLSSRAASVVVSASEREPFASAIEALQAEHRLRERVDGTDEQRAAIRARAVEARALMREWAQRGAGQGAGGIASGEGGPGASSLPTSASGVVMHGGSPDSPHVSDDVRAWGHPSATGDSARSDAQREDGDFGMYRDALRAYFKSLSNQNRAHSESER